MRLDRTDWVLIRELYGWYVGNYPSGALRISLPVLGKRVGLHQKTVKLRLQALRRNGVIEGPYFEPRPDLLGLQMSGYGLEGIPPHDAASLESALASEPAVNTVVFASGYAYVVFMHEAGADPGPIVERLRRGLGATDHWESFARFDLRGAAAVPYEPSDLDWRLILALRRPPARSLAAVARELHVTARTAERRARRLIERGAGWMRTRFRPSRVEGSLYVHYVVMKGDGRAAASLAEAFPDRVIGPFGGETRPNVGVAVESLEEAERRRAEAEDLPGIEKVGLYLVRDWIFPLRFDRWLEARVAKRTRRVRQGDILDGVRPGHDRGPRRKERRA